MPAALGELEVFACLDIMFLAFVADHTLYGLCSVIFFSSCAFFTASWS
jgi:hypothetical protein